jgi:hypothetical protein
VTDTFRVGLIGGIAQITVAVIGLVGALATADGGGSSGATVGSESTDGSSCTAVYERYRTLVRLHADAFPVLTTPGPDGLSPVEADADARRCGLSEAALRAMR